MLNRRPDPVVSTLMPVPANASFARRSAASTSSKTRSELIDCSFTVICAREKVAGNHAFELVPPLPAQGEDEQLLGDGRGVRRNHVRFTPAVVQLAVNALHVVGDRRHLAHVRERAAARSCSWFIRASMSGRFRDSGGPSSMSWKL